MNTNGNAWQDVIYAIPGIIWGIIGLISFFLVLKYVIQPWMRNCHELKMRKAEIEHEKELSKTKVEKANSDETLKTKIKELTKRNNDLECKLGIEQTLREGLNKHLEEYKHHLNIIMANLKNQ